MKRRISPSVSSISSEVPIATGRIRLTPRFLAVTLLAISAIWAAHSYAGVTGKIAWAFKIPTTDYTEFQPTPAIGINGTIFVATYSNLYALNFDGSQAWSSPVPLGSTFDKSHGALSSPAIGCDGTIYIGTAPYDGSHYHGTLLAVNPSDGSVIWTWSLPSPDTGAVFSTPAIGADVYIATDDDGIVAGINGGEAQWLGSLPYDVDSSGIINSYGLCCFLRIFEDFSG